MKYSFCVRELLRRHFRFFLWATLAALALRLLFVIRFPAITDDSYIYGEIAKNWLQDSIYGLGSQTGISPTLTRLPGYPAFLAIIFAIFGEDHYRAAMVVQVFVDIGTCFVIADLARRVISSRAVRPAFLLAALCPFTANYTAAALTETWEIFFTALALDFAVMALESFSSGKLRAWAVCGLAIGGAILFRPDGGLLLIGLGLYVLFRLIKAFLSDGPERGLTTVRWFKAGCILCLMSFVPLMPWTVRNLWTLHRLQPLAPRYANEEDQFVSMGFNHWVKTWMADYASVEEIYWQVPGAAIDPSQLPSRAFDSAAQREQTLAVIADYNSTLTIGPELDARFAKLAWDRIQDHPLRYYVSLPAVRIVDMWLRPRTELLPSDRRWWEFNDDTLGSVLAIAMGCINFFYVAAALGGPIRRRQLFGAGLLLAFVVVRSLFLGSLENPEPRYTLECLPVLFVLASSAFS